MCLLMTLFCLVEKTKETKRKIYFQSLITYHLNVNVNVFWLLFTIAVVHQKKKKKKIAVMKHFINIQISTNCNYRNLYK